MVEALQSENQQLAQENMRLSQRLRRSSTDSLLSTSAGVNVPSPLTSGPLSGSAQSPPLNGASLLGFYNASPGNVHLKSGSIADLRQHSASSSINSFSGPTAINSAASSDSELNFSKGHK